MKDVDPRYMPTVPDGYIHWDNVVDESVTLQERIAALNADGVPVEDVLVGEFVPQDGYNKPMTTIFVRDVHVGKARLRQMQVEAMLLFLRGMGER